MAKNSEEITLYQIPSPSERRRIHADIVRKKEHITDDQYHVFIQMGLSDIRTELTGMNGYLTMLSEGDFGKLPNKQKEIVENLSNSAKEMIDDAHNLLALGKLSKQDALGHKSNDNKRYKILHFEDERMLRDMYGTKFRMYGFEFAGYDSPTKDPVSLVLKEKPDLIIMDIIMPISDGFTATEQLKADSRTKHIPILGLCNLGQKADIEKAHSLGMADYFVSAQHTPTEVVKRVCQLIGIPVPKERPIPSSEVQRETQKRSWWQFLR